MKGPHALIFTYIKELKPTDKLELFEKILADFDLRKMLEFAQMGPNERKVWEAKYRLFFLDDERKGE